MHTKASRARTADAQNEFGVCLSLAVFLPGCMFLFLQASSREAAPYYCNYDLYTFHYTNMCVCVCVWACVNTSPSW